MAIKATILILELLMVFKGSQPYMMMSHFFDVVFQGCDVRLPARPGRVQPVRADHRRARPLRDGRGQVGCHGRGQASMHLPLVLHKYNLQLLHH